MADPAVHIARCPTHGLHGERHECFICHGPVEQIPMVPITNRTWTIVVCPHCGEEELPAGMLRAGCAKCGTYFSRDDERPEDRDTYPDYWNRIKHRYPTPGTRVKVAEIAEIT